MLHVSLLAKVAPNAIHFQPVTRFPGQSDLLTWCNEMGVGTSFLLVIVGVVYLLYGWSMYKPLVGLNAAIIGVYCGAMIGQRYDSQLFGGCIGCGVALATALPLMKWAVAVIGGIVGAVLGASIWRTAGLEPNFAWAGGMTGLVGFGLFSFILFRGSLIMYTSLQGALMVIVGMLGLALKYPETASQVANALASNNLLLPMAVFIPAAVGLFYQQKHGSGGGSAPAMAGAGGGEKKK